MAGAFTIRRFFIFSGLLSVLILSACSGGGQSAAPTSPVVEVTRLVEKTVLVTQVVEVEKVVTATAEPTAPAPLPTSGSPGEQAATPAAGASLPGDGFAGWCVPKDVLYSPQGVEQAGTMPEGSRPIEVVDGEMQAIIEVQNCTFVYTLDGPVPAGAQLKMYDNSGSAFLTANLTPTTQFPNKGFVTVNHPYVVNPPFWTIPYRLDLVDAGGKTLRSDVVNFKRGWVPRTCWDGAWPDPVTLICKVKGEAHPWDPWYGSEYPYQPTAVIED